MTNSHFDNAGSGFNLEDDEDLASMLGRAERASEDDGDLNIRPETRPGEVAAPEKPAYPSFEEQDDFAVEPIAEIEPLVAPEPEPEPEPEPVVEPEPAPVVKPVRTPESEPAVAHDVRNARGRVRVPSEAEQITDVTRTVAILDAYRSLSAEEKAVTVQFVTTGEMDSADDATVVVKVLNADPMLVTTMRALREAYEHDLVERAFYAMSLETKTLHSLGSLVAVFSDKDYQESQSNLDYSRQVVADIANLGDREISFVKATESVLAAAETAGR